MSEKSAIVPAVAVVVCVAILGMVMHSCNKDDNAYIESLNDKRNALKRECLSAGGDVIAVDDRNFHCIRRNLPTQERQP